MANEIFIGGPGDDVEVRSERFIYGINGNDVLIGRSDEATQAYGGEGNDVLRYTGNSTSKLYGDDGNDELGGGAQADVLSGGDGADLFVFSEPLGSGNVDEIVDFQPGIDAIVYSGSIMPALGSKVSKGEFREGTKARDHNDHLIYNSDHGKLYYDEDGKGGADRILFARIAKHLDLDHHDFILAV